MIYGYMGKLLFVNLTTGKISEETRDESFYRKYIGGAGLGARILYDRMPAGADPLGPDNILGFTTGPLTGVPGLQASRFIVVCKSPLTGAWADSNSGGYFAPYLKYAGYDAVSFSGISPKPVYERYAISRLQKAGGRPTAGKWTISRHYKGSGRIPKRVLREN